MSGAVARLRKLAPAIGGLAVTASLTATALALPSPAAQALSAQAGSAQALPARTAATGNYTPSANEWWLANWRVKQQVWPLTEGAGVTVAVIDSGVQASVPDLRGVVLRGGDVLGDRGNGEIDYDSGEDGHGTAVAVLIAGQGYGTGTIGIAPKAKILPVHAAYPQITNVPAAIAKGIEYAVNHGARVINVSLGEPVPSATSCDPVLQDAVAYALARGVVVVAGSGDINLDGSGPLEPASCAGVLAVGGVQPSGTLWQYSSRGPDVSVVAPADDMVYVGSDGRYTTTGAGTSFSSPLVAGAAALIRSRFPSMPWYDVVQRLIGTTIHVGSPVPNDSYGYGIINVAKAVNPSAYPVSASSPDPVYARYLAWLRSPAGQAWAKGSGVRVPTAASASGSDTKSAAAAPASTAKSASGSSGAGTLIIVVVVIVALLAAAALVLGLRRDRSE